MGGSGGPVGGLDHRAGAAGSGERHGQPDAISPPLGASPRSGGARAGGTAGRAAAPGRSSGPAGAAAGLEALRLAVHAPGQVVLRLERFLFPDAHQRVAFDALLAEDELHAAVAHAEALDPAAAALLRRVAVEEPVGDPDGVVAQLVRNATRRCLARLDAEARLAPDRFADLAAETAHVHLDLQALDTNEADADAAARLVAWLGTRVEEDA